MAISRKRGRASSVGRGLLGLAMVLIVYVDLTVNTSILGLAASAIQEPYVNPPPKNMGDKKLKVTPVALFVRMSWGSKLPHDIDTWVQCYHIVDGQETKVMTVGYSRKSDGWLDLLRDDQGGLMINEEQLQSNSEIEEIPPKTFCHFNVHLFNSHGGPMPVTGKMIIIQNKDGENETLISDVSFTLEVPGQEITLVTAGWDDRGNLMADALETYPKVETQLIATRAAN